MSLSRRLTLLPAAICLCLAASGCAGLGGAPVAVPTTAIQARQPVAENTPASPVAPSTAVQAAAPVAESIPASTQAAGCASKGPQVDACPVGQETTSPPAQPPKPAVASSTPWPQPSPTACPPNLCVYTNAFPLARPVAPPARDTIDTSYRFGSTQDGLRDPHHGVEFLNPAGTPVLAAAEGVVIVAGDDRTTFYGPYSYFYGNLVVVEHELPGLAGPLFTLYGHLSEISVQEGERVRLGQQVGLVGMSGVATGSHLHFEVRLGENTYASARNPELWLAPHSTAGGQPMGALAGRILDPHSSGQPIPVVLQRMPAPGQPANQEIYLQTYQEKALLGLPPYEESFAAGDLPAGWYRISFARYGIQEQVIQVFPNQITVVTFRFGE